MLDLAPPPPISLPKPAVIRPLVDWIDKAPQLPDDVRRAIEAEARHLGIVLPLGFMTQGTASTRAVSYIGVNTSYTVAGSTYTFSSVSIGTAAADRVVVVCIVADASTTRYISGMTINGPSSAFINNSLQNQCPAGIGYLLVTSGTTTAVTVTFSAAVNAIAVFVATLTGLSSTTVSDSLTAGGTGTAASRTLALTYPAGGIGIYGHGHKNTNATTWTNSTKYGETTLNSATIASMGIFTYPAGGSLTETMSWTSSVQSSAVGGAWS